MTARPYGETPLVLSSLVIFPYTYSTDTIGTAITLPEQQELTIDFLADVAILKSGGMDIRQATVTTGADFMFSAAGITWEAFTTLVNTTLASPSAGVETQRGEGGGIGLPYFGIAGKVVDSVGGDLHVGLIACKLNKVPGWKVGKDNEFMVSEMEGHVVIPSGRKIPYYEKHQTAAAINLTTLFA